MNAIHWLIILFLIPILMIDVNDLMKDDTQEIEISNGILVQVKCKLSILDQQTIM